MGGPCMRDHVDVQWHANSVASLGAHQGGCRVWVHSEAWWQTGRAATATIDEQGFVGEGRCCWRLGLPPNMLRLLPAPKNCLCGVCIELIVMCADLEAVRRVVLAIFEREHCCCFSIRQGGWMSFKSPSARCSDAAVDVGIGGLQTAFSSVNTPLHTLRPGEPPVVGMVVAMKLPCAQPSHLGPSSLASLAI